MSGVLGVHLKVVGGRYVAGFAWVESGTVRTEPSLAAPAETDRGLSELYQRALELARKHPTTLALLKNEALRAPASLRIAARAEGVVIAAAQHMQVAVAEWAGSGLYKAAGLPKAKGVTVKMAVARLVAESGSNSADDAQSLAIAVAVAEAKRTGAF